MDEVWLVSLCLTVLALVIAVFSLKKSDDKSESSAKGKKERSSEPVYSSSPQPTARCMELTLEDIEKSLERLGAVLGTEPPTATAKGTAPWRHAPDSDTQASLLGPEEQQQYRRVGRVSEPQGWAEDSDNDTWSHAERQVKIEPSEQVDPRRHGGGEGREVLEHPPATSATQNIMDQIEQAVQETLDHNRERSEFIRVRRAPPAPRLETPPRDDVLQPRSLQSSD